MAAVSGLFVLATLGACEETAHLQADQEDMQATDFQTGHPTTDRPFPDEFINLAPPDWRLRQVSNASAKYDVQIASGADDEPIVVRGVVLLDGRFERYLSPLDFSPSAIASDRKEFGDIPAGYPTVDGFEMVVDSGSLGFDANRSLERRSIKYFNRDQAVFCRGTSPGLLRCLWGNSKVRLVLNFHSDRTVPALKYIRRNVFSE